MPPFRPHITLFAFCASGEEAKAKLAKLTEIEAFDVQFDKLAVRPASIWECLFILIKNQAELTALRAKAAELAGERDEWPYMPHLSLLYADEKQLDLNGRHAALDKLGKDRFAGLGYRVSSVVAMDTTADDWRDWKQVAEFPLKTPEAEGDDLKYLRRCNELARSAVAKGNHPFGSLLVLDGQVVLEAENAVMKPETDGTKHAELNLVSLATRSLSYQQLQRAVLYTSTEPCPMCCGAIYWSGISTVVYCTGHGVLGKVTGDIMGGARDIFSTGTGRTVKVRGPIIESEGIQVHEDFNWRKHLGLSH